MPPVSMLACLIQVTFLNPSSFKNNFCCLGFPRQRGGRYGSVAKVKESPTKQQKVEHHSNTNGSGEDMTRSFSQYNDEVDNDSSWDDINSTSTPNVSTLAWEGLNDQLR